MLLMYGFDGGAPVHRAHGGIAAASREVFGVGGDAVDLTVLPRWTENVRGARRARPDAWYDLVWTAPEDRIFLDAGVFARSTAAERERLALLLAGAGVLRDVPGMSEEERLEQVRRQRGVLAGVLRRRALGRAGALPQPGVRPFPERLRAAGEVTLEGMTPGAVRFCGGQEAALRMLRLRQRVAVENDRSVDVYDWDGWGRAAIAALPVPVRGVA